MTHKKLVAGMNTIKPRNESREKPEYNNKVKIRLLDQVLDVLYVRSIISFTLSSDVSYPAGQSLYY